MGTAELIPVRNELLIRSHIITYGTAADAAITERIRQEIETRWNEPDYAIRIRWKSYSVRFQITAACEPELQPETVYSDTDPANNYFRIEPYSYKHISFVDGLGCNTGYFLLENLYEGSTTAAHEYGHTLGLPHPQHMDIRGQGVPGIMYPRGTLVDPVYQYEPGKPAGVKGGTLHPMFRRVKKQDIEALRLQRLRWSRGKAIVGDFSSVWHAAHIQQ